MKKSMTVGSCTSAMVVMLLAGAAAGQSVPYDPTEFPQVGPGMYTCRTRTGPDVIVGDITGQTQYTAHNLGTVGDPNWVDAASFGTTSCNLGTVWLNWFDAGSDNSNQHPVITQNLFKWTQNFDGASRFEHLGQSWLKHGFFALSNTLCCSTCSTTNGNYLGVGCADPYSSSRNGNQGGAGPKWQVNASNGYFPVAIGNPTGGTANSTARRLRVKVAELQPSVTTGSNQIRYFIESQYVTPDDALAGNKNNNASYRAVTIAGTGNERSWTLTSSTQRQKPGIVAWYDTDTSGAFGGGGVRLHKLDVPGDGRFFVGWKVTQIDANTWHYEYAIQNLSSNRSAASFSVPVPCGVEVHNVEFRDVEYHSLDGIPSNPSTISTANSTGRNFDSTDWVPSKLSGVVTEGYLSWDMVGEYNPTPMMGVIDGDPTVAGFQASPDNNPANNHNALRWGTMYTFRFRANTPPQDVGATLGLYRTAEDRPNDYTLSIQGPSAPAGAVPANNNAADAIAVNAGDSVNVQLACATSDGSSSCGSGNDVWYSFTAPAAGSLTLTPGGTGTAVSVHTGTPGTTGNEVVCGSSAVSTNLNSGATVLIRLSGTGSASLNVGFEGSGPDCSPCPADFNGDSGVDDLDIAAFFAAFEEGGSCADVNGDEGIDDLDIAAFFASFEQGC